MAEPAQIMGPVYDIDEPRLDALPYDAGRDIVSYTTVADSWRTWIERYNGAHFPNGGCDGVKEMPGLDMQSGVIFSPDRDTGSTYPGYRGSRIAETLHGDVS